MKTIRTLIAMVMMTTIATSCAVIPLSTTETTYADTHKSPENISVSYNWPVIVPTSTTKQIQTKGGVDISVEIVPFESTLNVKKEKTVGYADLSQPGYDVFETKNIPQYVVTSNGTNQVQFRLKIRNHEEVPLILSQVGFILTIDGISFSFPEGYKRDWNEGLIITGEEKTYSIKGPDISGLSNAKVVRLFLNGVPTAYDVAGNIKKKENFEWFFECKTERIERAEQITYTYETEPIYREKCSKCSGTGVDPQAYKCNSCNGKGTYVSVYDKKTYTCSQCKGSGKVHYKCGNCGGRGENAFPKSQTPPVTSSITWNGAQVQVLTNPPGAKVSVVNTKTKEYSSAGMSNARVNWYSSDQKSYPIVVEYQGKTVKVLPYSETGKLIPKVVIDFLGSNPVVTKGVLVN